MSDLDHCPTCGREIRDFDPAGAEDGNGQRHCIEHPVDPTRRMALVVDEADAELLQQLLQRELDGIGDRFPGRTERVRYLLERLTYILAELDQVDDGAAARARLGHRSGDCAHSAPVVAERPLDVPLVTPSGDPSPLTPQQLLEDEDRTAGEQP